MERDLGARGTGWLGHREIPRPAVVQREPLLSKADWLDCVLAIWIAEAMLWDGVKGKRDPSHR